jgi:DUF4097 and DUF4098 domain-containing protein YvlB
MGFDTEDSMSRSSGLGFGGFLVGLGAGWVVFTYFEITHNMFSWLIILAGIAVIAGSLISRSRPRQDIGGLMGGLVGGLILSLFITSGFGFFTDVFDGGSIGSYTAHDTKTFNGAITASSISLDIDNFNGPISVSTWSKDEYSVELDIRAKREEYLDDLKVDFDIMETQLMTQGISLGYDIPSTSKSRYAIGVEVFLPAGGSINLNLVSSNGGITLSDIEGERVYLRTSNGAFELNNVYAEEIDGETSNGALSGTFEAPDTSLSTSNGAIDLNLPCTLSGNYRLSTSNSRIDLKLSSNTQVGYDLEFSTSNGNINVDAPNLEYTTNQSTRKVAKTENFASKNVKITIDADTSNSNIDVDT